MRRNLFIINIRIMEIDLTDKRKTEELVQTYSDMIMRIAFQNLKRVHDAEDVMQETFLALIKKRAFKDEEHLKAWLIRVTVNKCRDALRRRSRRDLPLDAVNGFFSEPAQGEVMEEIFSLPPEDRTVIYLHYYEGYTAAEIGKILKKSANAVNIRLMRARERLKDVLIKEGGEDE